MITIRRNKQRGYADHGWLKSQHTFSFADYYDPDQMGFSKLRVINEDRVVAGAGFPTHGHRDMEIITYVLEGALEHKDSLGNSSVIRPGEVQRMSAGTGVTHSEYNHSQSEPVHFLQIWIEPDSRGVKPSYEQKQFPLVERHNQWRCVAAADGHDGAVHLHQDVSLYVADLSNTAVVSYTPDARRQIYLQVARGAVRVNGTAMEAGDGARIVDETALELAAAPTAELLLFDLP